VRRCGHGWQRAAAATALVAFSFNLVALGPTAHIKLLAFPALAMSLRHAILWEVATARGQRTAGHGIAAGLWLGLACNLLVSVLPAGVLATLLMPWCARRAGQPWPAALRAALPFALALAMAGAGLLLAAYFTALTSHTTQAGSFIEFLFGGLRQKQDLHVGVASVKEMPLRFAFSLVNNFVFLPTLGPLGRAWLWGMLPAPGPVLWSLLWQAALAGLTVTALAGALWETARALRSRGAPLLMATAFVAGAAAFSFYYNLNDPEHWFQFTLPVVFLMLQARRRWLDRLILGVWLPLLVVVNMSGYGVPKATFALEQRALEVREALGPEGLYVGFAAYPGEPDASLFRLDGIRRFPIDLVQVSAAGRNPDKLLALMDEAIDAAHARHGRVLVFRALDPYDWRGPAMQVMVDGMPLPRLQQHLRTRYAVTGPLVVGGFTAWGLEPKQR
jgi:hypothetical protein